tara:strand:- start:44 stop:370 length:327 start_codon:yes stop_codon:yes gene_type:complete
MEKEFNVHFFNFTKIENFDNAWDIHYKGESVGTATNFTDGYVATVKVGDFEKTVSAYHFEGLFDNAMEAYKETAQDEYLAFIARNTYHPSYSEIEANDRFWGSEAYDF